MSARPSPSGPGGGGGPDEVVEDSFACPDEAVGMVIGKGGTRVKRLEEETGCRVVHDKESSSLILRGSRRSIRDAKVQLSAIPSTMNMPPMPPQPADDEPPVSVGCLHSRSLVSFAHTHSSCSLISQRIKTWVYACVIRSVGHCSGFERERFETQASEKAAVCRA